MLGKNGEDFSSFEMGEEEAFPRETICPLSM